MQVWPKFGTWNIGMSYIQGWEEFARIPVVDFFAGFRAFHDVKGGAKGGSKGRKKK
jgi:hypothetical protein